MPDTLPPTHWAVLQLTDMGPEVYGWRRQREALSSVCLLHGTHECQVTFSRITPRLGAATVGVPINICTIVVRCWPSCGYRLTWA